MKTAARMDRVQPSATLAITSKAKAMKAKGRDVIGFGAGEPDFNTPQPILDAAKTALDEGMTKYGPVAGIPPLRTAIADWYNNRYGAAYGPANVQLTVGGKHALYNISQALLNDGDKVLIPAPFWVSYPAQVKLAGGDPIFVQSHESDGFALTADALAAAIDEHKPRALILNSPSNPTGGAIDRQGLSDILDVVRATPDLVLVWDSIYEQLTYDGFEHVEPGQIAPDLNDRIVIVSGFSKAYAMTGWRLGYSIAPPDLAKAMSKLQSHCTSGATTFAQAGALAALELDQSVLDQMLATFDGRRQRMVELLRAIDGVTVPTPKGAFYAFPNFNAYLGKKHGDQVIESDMALADYLLDNVGVAVVPGSAFGAPGYVRLSYALGMDSIEAGLGRIAEALTALS